MAEETIRYSLSFAMTEAEYADWASRHQARSPQPRFSQAYTYLHWSGTVICGILMSFGIVFVAEDFWRTALPGWAFVAIVIASFLLIEAFRDFAQRVYARSQPTQKDAAADYIGKPIEVALTDADFRSVMDGIEMRIPWTAFSEAVVSSEMIFLPYLDGKSSVFIPTRLSAGRDDFAELTAFIIQRVGKVLETAEA
jgi:hypothetical protein